jgi:arabinogalactan endo-1,4-beta-galactosidase
MKHGNSKRLVGALPRRIPIRLALLCIFISASPAFAEDHPFYLGGDISALPNLEKFGAVYRDHGKAADAITILRDHHCNLFRVRLFVDPVRDFDQAAEANQDLPMVLNLCRRIKTAGGKLSLALHYSDTWADPAHQIKPAAWKDLSFDALRKKVNDYTSGVLRAMKSNGTEPDIIEVGNETTDGMLWPNGKLDGKTPQEKQTQWDCYIQLENAGIQAVRAQLPHARVLIHISNGGKPKLPGWFFGKMKEYSIDYDIIGLSFYPSWGDSIEALKANLRDLPGFGKDILVIETAYPSRTLKPTACMTWPVSPAGQKQFLDDLISAVKETKDHRGIGVVWWYPEALPIARHQVWNGGAQGWFDAQGSLLPALSER